MKSAIARFALLAAALLAAPISLAVPPAKAPKPPEKPKAIVLKVRPLPGFYVTKPHQAVIRNAEEWRQAMRACGYSLPPGAHKMEKDPWPPVPKGVDLSKEVIAFISLRRHPSTLHVAIESATYAGGMLTLQIRKHIRRGMMGKGEEKRKTMAMVAIERPPMTFAFVNKADIKVIHFETASRFFAIDVRTAVVANANAYRKLRHRFRTVHSSKWKKVDFTKQSVIVLFARHDGSNGEIAKIVTKAGKCIVYSARGSGVSQHSALSSGQLVLVDLPKLSLEKVTFKTAPVKLKVRLLKMNLKLGKDQGFITKPHQAVVRNKEEWRKKMLPCAYTVPGVKFIQPPVPSMPKGFEFTGEVVVFLSRKEKPGTGINIESAGWSDGKLTVAYSRRVGPVPMRPFREGEDRTPRLPFSFAAVERPPLAFAFVDAPKKVNVAFKKIMQGDRSEIRKAATLIITDNNTYTNMMARHYGPDVKIPESNLDFTKSSVVAVFQGGPFKTVGASVKITRIEKTGDGHVVHVNRTTPVAGAKIADPPMAPFHIVMVNVPNLKAKFVIHQVNAAPVKPKAAGPKWGE